MENPKKGPPKRLKMTEPWIRGLERGDKPTTWWDTVQPGLGLTVQVSGTKSWTCMYPYLGLSRWYHIGTFPAVGIATARDAAKKVRAKAALGEDPQGAKMEARKALKQQHARARKEKAMARAVTAGKLPSLSEMTSTSAFTTVAKVFLEDYAKPTTNVVEMKRGA